MGEDSVGEAHFEKQKWGRMTLVRRILKSKNGGGKMDIVGATL